MDGERTESAGLREFKEETGVAMAITFEKSATISTEEFVDRKGQRFSCTYVILAHEECDSLAKLINENITIGYIGSIADDELENVEWCRIQDAADKLNTPIIVGEKYRKKAYQPKDWWAYMIEGAGRAIAKAPRVDI